MSIKQYEIWIADLNPRFGTETGKVRPVLIVQTDLLNRIHPSTIICPITTNVQKESELVRVHLEKGAGNVIEACDIMIDQIRTIDNKRLIKKIGKIPTKQQGQLIENLKIVFDLLY